MQLRLQDLLSKIERYHPTADTELIQKAYSFAVKAHDGQLRRSGDPYVIHPLGVASTIAELKLDVPSVCAGLLHDCVEDTSATTDDITKEFGAEIAFLVDGVTKLGKIAWNNKEERQAENFRKMLLAMARDIRVILIKLADRIDNMRTLDAMPPDKQERIARETMEIYAPLANRLGIQWVKIELEDLSFKYLYPKEYEEVSRKVIDYHKERQAYLDEVSEILRKELTEAGVQCEVYGRPKHLWSIRTKMVKTGRELEQLFDIVAFRVIVESVRACYETLGVVHSKWTPIPGRFKDFIALPKPNMYQSLHTSLIGPRGERMEVQIRTADMHRVAEEGIAAHWRYKEGRPHERDDKDNKRFAWLRQLMEWQKDLKDPTEFIETVKMDMFADEVYVFTPKGDVKALPKGAIPIDLAYAIHTEVGNHCSGARVNGLIVPLRYTLRNGDTVEIITSPNQKPNKDWLKYVITSSGKAKIRNYMRTAEREKSKALGKELIERELRKYGYSYAKVLKAGELEKAQETFKAQSIDDLLISVGYGKVLPADVVETIVPENKRKEVPAEAQAAANPLTQLATSLASTIMRRVTARQSAGIKVAGEADVLVRFAKCCSPVVGDPIVGFITRGRGVTVHTLGCQKSLDQDPDRKVEVEWDGKLKTPRPVQVQVVCADKPGLLASLSQSFNQLGVNIAQANCRAADDNKAINTFQFNVTDLEQLKTVMRALQRISGVYSVSRM